MPSGNIQKIIKEFFYIFGTQTTTNHDLMRYAKILKIKNFHVVMSDEVKDLPNENFSAILNFQLSSENGSHWVSLYSHDTNSHDKILFYFDSYGTPVQKQVIDKYKHIRTHDYKIQPLTSSMCGQLSLLVIYLLTNGYKYENTIKSLLKNEF